MKLTAERLSCGYGKQAIIKNIGFSLSEGEVLGVVGPNGSGKTTLFRALMRFLPLLSGRVEMDGEDAAGLPLNVFAQKMSYIPQSHTPAFSYTVEEMAMMGRASHIPPFGSPGKKDREAVSEALRTLRILHLKDKYYTEISGGERRLALIARALCQQARILVMDEPSADLDYANQRLVQDTVQELKERGYGIILSTHAPEYPFSVATRVLLLKDGETVAYGEPKEALTAQTLRSAFVVAMDVVEVTDSNGNRRRMCLPL